MHAFEFELIAETRFDKLLEELISTRIKDRSLNNEAFARFAGVIARATRLHLKWIQNFKGRYFIMDEERLRTMRSEGRLQHVTLDPGERQDGERWLVTKVISVSEKEADEKFEPGA
jgi:hypothetical protein